VRIETFASVNELPPGARRLLSEADGPFAGLPWWDVVLSDAMPDGAKACFVTVHCGDDVVAMAPMLRSHGRLNGLTTLYTCTYTPLLAVGLNRAARVAAMAAFARCCRGGSGVTRLDALPEEWDGLPDLLAGAREAGLRVLRFEHFGNWYEDVRGLDWPAYLLGRTGALRETIRRRLKRAERLPEARFSLLTRTEEMDAAAEAFEAVYSRSWKQPEPFPTFNVALMRAMACAGTLRFGLWSIGGQPVAVQVWVVTGNRATVLKLAHDEAFKAHSPGTVLTALMLRHLLDREHVAEIDFGRGDDPYKKDWASQRRRRIGVLLVNPWRMAGIAALLRHAAGRARLAIRSRHGPDKPDSSGP
jgi:CelD/BcsL family acetyltransferase involved in cellulose biosynthesis